MAFSFWNNIDAVPASTYYAKEVADPLTAQLSVSEQKDSLPPKPPPPKHLHTPVPLKGVYMTSWVAGTPSFRDTLITFMRTSEINAVVIDVKDYSGQISFDTDDDLINELGSEDIRVPDMKNLIDRLHAEGVYVIARISVFQDPIFSAAYPHLAVQTKAGEIWKDRKGLSWVDPASTEMWNYIARVAEATEQVGFDELNFDYIRFPSDGNMQDISFPVWDEVTPRSDILETFFAYMDKRLEHLGIPISLDIFGMTTVNYDDLNIGQVLEKAAPHADYISPMVYPSHYPTGFQGLVNPADHPYAVINDAMAQASHRLRLIGEDPKKLRPWLQDFDLGAIYTEDMILQQKQAVYDAGLDSWIFWDPRNIYTKEAFR